MFDSIVAEAIRLSRIDDQQKEVNAKRLERQRAELYYDGRTKEETKTYFDDTLLTQIAISNNNITRRIINRISGVYLNSPDRKTEANGYEELTRGKTPRFRRAERLTNLLKYIALKVTVRDGKFDYDIIKDFEPIFGDDPLVPIGITFPIAVSSAVLDDSDEIWEVWTDQDYFRVIKGGDIIPDEANPEHINPYGIMPVMFIHADGVPEGSFTDVDPCLDLIETNLSINIAETEKNANIRFQSFGYPWITGADTDQEILISQNAFTKLPLNAKMGIESPPNTISSVTEAIKFKYAYISLNYGLDAQFAEGTAQESGLSRQMRNLELTESRSGQLSTWRDVETDAYKIEQAIAKVEFKKTWPDEFGVDFHEKDLVLSEQEKRDNDDYEIGKGYTNAGETLFEADKDRFTDENEALETVKANLSITKGLESPLAPLATSLGDNNDN